MADVQGEMFGREMDGLLDDYSESIQSQLQPFIELILSRVDELVANGADITDEQLEEITAGLNDAAARVIGSELNAMQPAIADQAERWGATAAKEFLPGPLLLELAEMDGTSLAKWFQRRSPSKWMGAVMRAVRKGIDDGWDPHRAVTGQSIEALVVTVAESSVWSAANGQMIRTWTARELIWQTRQDELVCEICRPLDQTRFSGASNGPPSHPRCRCVALPAPANTG